MSTHVRQLWGTAISLDVRQPCPPEVVDEVFEWFERVDGVFSTWREDSEVSRLHRGELRVEACSADLRTVMQLCDEVTEETRGAFDIRVGADPRVAARPGLAPLDPSGIVKGWALERASTRLREQGIDRFSITAGGDLIVADPPPGRDAWCVGIQHPFERGCIAAAIGCTRTGVATSGRYELGDHIIDPRSGRPARGLMAATVVCDDLARADAYATAAIVMGDDAMEWLTDDVAVAALVITNDREVVTNDAFAALRSR